MRGGPRQIQQDSQRLKGGGGGRSSINLHTKRGLPHFFNILF